MSLHQESKGDGALPYLWGIEPSHESPMPCGVLSHHMNPYTNALWGIEPSHASLHREYATAVS